MKHTLILLLLLLLLPITAHASDFSVDELMQRQLIDSNAEQAFEQVDSDVDFITMIKDMASGKWTLNPSEILDVILKTAFEQFYLTIAIFIRLIVYGILAALITNLSDSFEKKGISEAAFYATLLLIAREAVVGYTSMVDVSLNALDNLVSFIYGILPVVLSLLATGGGVISASYFAPIILASSQIIIIAIKQVFIPLLMVTTALAITDCIGEKFGLSRMVKLLKSCIKWGLGLMLTIFVGIVSLQSIVAPAADSIAAKTTKFAISSFIPIVGGSLSDSFDIVMGLSKLLKNAVGAAGLIAIIIIVFTPVLRILVQSLLFKLAAACLEPICSERIVKCVTELSESLTFVFAMLATAAIMFIINLAIIINAGVS